MPSLFRWVLAVWGVCVVVGTMAAPAARAQGFGLGARLSMVKADSDSEIDSQRFTGGQMRLRMSPKTALEVSLDVHSDTSEDLTQKVREYPIQVSMLLYPIKGVFSPYLLGGPGWYSRKLELLDGNETLSSETTRRFGWHAGFGAELLLGKHAGIHADYRYTFLDFGDDDETDQPAAANGRSSFVSGFLPSYEGSMWTAGVTFYF